MRYIGMFIQAYNENNNNNNNNDLEAFIQARAETKKIQTCSSKDFKGKSENYVMLMSQQLVKRSKNICHAILWWKAKNSASKNSACKENQGRATKHL